MVKGSGKAKRKRKGDEAEVIKQTEQAEVQSEAVATTEEGPVSVVTTGESAKPQQTEEESTHEKYERIKKGQLYLTDLQKLSVSELHEMAKKDGITEYTALKKQELIFRILKERIRQNGLMYGEGVLEVLPDGYGFLRNPDYNYLSSPDDIYVSPSQIRRFGLRTGNEIGRAHV
jgi:hypothetical protein